MFVDTFCAKINSDDSPKRPEEDVTEGSFMLLTNYDSTSYENIEVVIVASAACELKTKQKVESSYKASSVDLRAKQNSVSDKWETIYSSTQETF